MIVVDASVLANVLADDRRDGSAARAAVRGDELAAPDLVDVETIAVLRKRWLAGSLPDDRFDEAIGDLEDLALARFPALPLIRRAFELRANVTPYDAIYVGLAEVLDAPLLTADRRLASAPGPRCEIRVVGPDGR